MSKFSKYLIGFVAGILAVGIGLSLLHATPTLTPTASGVAICGVSVLGGTDIDMSLCNSGMLIPSGTAAQRPGSPVNGTVRYNTDSNLIEAYAGSAWGFFGQPWVVAAATHAFTTNTGAAGFQISSSRNSIVHYNVKISVTATIGAQAEGYVALEIAPTNSATAGDWIECGRSSNGQNITLAIALQSVQAIGAEVSCNVPIGYYAKLRTVNVAGTPTYTYISGYEVLM